MTMGVAVLGTGRIVETGYVPAFNSIDNANLVAVLSRDIARAEVAHDRTSRGFAQIRRLANLQTRGRWLAGIVKDRLAMQPDQLGRGIAAP